MKLIKSADAWAVIISAFALVVSGLTWLDVRQQLRLAAGQSRSYVQVFGASLKEPLARASFIEVELKLKNFGPTAATDVYGGMDYQIGMPDPKGEENSATSQQFGAMGPGMERTVTLKSNRYNRRDWPAPSLRNYQTVYFYGTIWFTDETTKERRKEDWCYSLPIRSDADLQRHELELCGSLSYKSRDSSTEK